MEAYKIGRYNVSITHPQKVLFERPIITKQELVDYYQAIAPHVLPLIKNHPISLQRFVEGISKPGFFQKNASEHWPAWIKRLPINTKEGETVHYVTCNNAASLVYLANQGAITFHAGLSKAPKLLFPDRMVFDIDPGKQPFTVVCTLAHALNTALGNLGLTAYPMITGSHGVHVVVPLKQTDHFDVVHDFAAHLARIVADYFPKQATVEIRKQKRRGRAFIDFLRNSFGATSVAPYSVRPLPGAPVATPVSWQELGHSVTSPQQYTIKTVLNRVAHQSDPWAQFYHDGQSIKGAIRRLDALSKTTP